MPTARHIAAHIEKHKAKKRKRHSLKRRTLSTRARREQGEWVPASGGTETPFISRSGARLLYVWQPSTGKKAYLNLDSDIVLTDAQADRALGIR